MSRSGHSPLSVKYTPIEYEPKSESCVTRRGDRYLAAASGIVDRYATPLASGHAVLAGDFNVSGRTCLAGVTAFVDAMRERFGLAAIFHTGSDFSMFPGDGYGKDGSPACFSTLARPGGVASTETPFLAVREDGPTTRRKRHAVLGSDWVRPAIRPSAPAASAGSDGAETGPTADNLPTSAQP